MVRLEIDGSEDLELLRWYLLGKKIPYGKRILIPLEESMPAPEFGDEKVFKIWHPESEGVDPELLK